MSASLDLTGQRFGRLTVETFTRRGGARAWTCRCDCGNAHVATTTSLRCGDTRSCGCLQADVRRTASRTHGGSSVSQGGEYHPLFTLWCGMIHRCTSPKNRRYHGRGIKVCDRWEDFAAFVADMGPRPSPKHSLDRINNDGNYEPGNVRWATPAQQSRNTRSNIAITIAGETRVAADWARENGIDPYTAYRRIRRGWDPAKAVTVPPIAAEESARWAGKGSPFVTVDARIAEARHG